METLHAKILTTVTSSNFNGLDKETALLLASAPESSLLDILALARLAAFTALTQENFTTCGIISAKTGKCSEDCTFCAQSAHYPTGSATHPLVSYDDLARRAEELFHQGVDRFGIVTSGHNLSPKEYDELYESIAKISTNFPHLRFCASLGKANEEQACKLIQAGFTRYHHNLETSASYYPHICTTHPYQDRLDTIRAVRKAGMEVCSGGILGLGESWEQRIELALTVKKEGVNAVPINFLNAIANTPLEKQPKLLISEALLAIALFRLLLPKKDILICGGRTHVLGKMQSWVTAAGANGLMVGNYLTTKGNSIEDDREMLEHLGVNALDPR